MVQCPGDALCHVAALLPKMHSEAEQFIAAYEEAIAVVVRRGAPLAAYSIDRRCLYNYAEFIQSGGPESLVCFFVCSAVPLHAGMAPEWHFVGGAFRRRGARCGGAQSCRRDL